MFAVSTQTSYFMRTYLCLFLLFPFFTQAQENERVSAFLDCEWLCDNKYIQEEIPYIDFIREPKAADVHIIVTENTTGSGGMLFSFKFIGQEQFNGKEDTLEVSLPADATEDERRIAHSKVLKKGLYPYALKSQEGNYLSISYTPKKQTETEKKEDPWKNWVFKLSASGNMNGEEGYQSKNYNGSFRADKITEAFKFKSSFYKSYSESIFDYEEFKLTTEQKSTNGNILAVKSINDHFSIGGRAKYLHSTYSNLEHSYSITPSIEYNIFPYSESNEHQLRILYGLGAQNNQYIDSTIFFKTHEYYFYQQLNIEIESTQKWGSIDMGLSAKDLFLDGDKYNLNFYIDVDVRLFKGLSVYGFGYYNLNRSQIELPSSGASYEEVLLRQRQLASNYDYYTHVGLRYTFGSLYNNVVNTRFD